MSLNVTAPWDVNTLLQRRPVLMQLAAALLLSAGQVALAEPVSLFDGTSLAGWQVVGDVEWSVADGTVQGAGSGDGFLSSDGEYGDFTLHAEFWVDATTNSGIFVRCRDRARIHPDTCYEMNIWDQHPQQEARTGAIVFRSMPPLVQVETVGRWNTYDIKADGATLEVRVNGEITAILEDADPTPGFIALQHWEQGTVKFRNLRLQQP